MYYLAGHTVIIEHDPKKERERERQTDTEREREREIAFSIQQVVHA